MCIRDRISTCTAGHAALGDQVCKIAWKQEIRHQRNYKQSDKHQGSLYKVCYTCLLYTSTYLGDAYDNHKPLEYFLKSKPKLWFVHPQTKKELEGLLRILNDKGEEKALWYIKHVYLKGKDK